MKLIAHRGNTEGNQPKLENKPSYIDRALNDELFEAEIDVWYVNKKWWLGHDEPQYKLKYEWMYARHQQLWIHCKNIEALAQFNSPDLGSISSYFNYFWHQDDSYTLTSFGYIWAYPRKEVPEGGICLFPKETNVKINPKWGGICSNFVEDYLWLI